MNALNLNLKQTFFTIKKDVVNPAINRSRVWYEAKECLVKSLGLSNDSNSIIVNKGLTDERTLPLNEKIYTSRNEILPLVKEFNSREQALQFEEVERLQKELELSEELYNFYEDLEKVQ